MTTPSQTPEISPSLPAIASAWRHTLARLTSLAAHLPRPAVSPYVWDLQGLGPMFEELAANPRRWASRDPARHFLDAQAADTLEDLVGDVLALLELLPRGAPEGEALTALRASAAALDEAPGKDAADQADAPQDLPQAAQEPGVIDALKVAHGLLQNKLHELRRANPRLSRAKGERWVEVIFEQRPVIQLKRHGDNPPPLVPTRREEPFEQDREAGARRALADLAAGRAKVYFGSGILGRRYDHDWDPKTGLPIVDTGCRGDPEHWAYNHAVESWIAEHGSPPGSMKPRFVTEELVQAALRTARPLPRGDELTAPDGRAIRRTAPDPGRPGSSHQLHVLSSAGHTTWFRWLSEVYDRIDVAWCAPAGWLVCFPGNAPSDRVYVWHVDADGEGILQTFVLTQPALPPPTSDP